MLTKKPLSSKRLPSGDAECPSRFSSLPYDLLLNIATFLDLRDVHALHLTCKALYDASTTRTVYRKLANDLLRRCRALPLKGFQRIPDLTTQQLIHSVNKANRLEEAWKIRSPRPIVSDPHNELGINPRSNYMDVTPGSALAKKMHQQVLKWYKIVSVPPDEEIDWLSPITSSYTLCATKSGKVVCWDVQNDTCLAEWNPGERWELWKCRVEFEERAVYFTMAKVLTDYHRRVMDFVLMRLSFWDGPSGESSPHPPTFSHVTEFKTTGVVMNVFLLDPPQRLLSAFILVAPQNTIGLYVLLDWDKKEYVFVDTGIECVTYSNWSCILHQQNIVIHCEESEAAYQFFYPLSLLQQYITKLTRQDEEPSISYCLSPARTMGKRFNFPSMLTFYDSDSNLDVDVDVQGYNPITMSQHSNVEGEQDQVVNGGNSVANGDNYHAASASTSLQGIMSLIYPFSAPSSSSLPPSSSSSSTTSTFQPQNPSQENANPFPFPPWHPESAHFVRQWWPSLPNIPRVNCTVILLAAHDQHPHRTRFVLAQHYFRVPLSRREWDQEPGPVIMDGKVPARAKIAVGNGKSPSIEDIQDDALMNLWYVSTPFEIVRVFDGMDEEDDGSNTEHPRPLVAVDFGHAVWIEYVDDGTEEDEEQDTQWGGGVGAGGDDDDDDDGVAAALESIFEAEMDTGTMMSNGMVDSDPKRLRFVTFPPFVDDFGVAASGRSSKNAPLGMVHTLATPPGLELGMVETINIDQSQGVVILSDKGGKIWVLCYE